MRLGFWFDFASTYSYLGALRVDAACAAAGVEVEHRPFLLGPIFQEQLGIKDSPFNVQPARGRYMWRDLERLCEKYRLPWRKPSVFPRHSVLAARVACCAGEAVAPLVRAVFRANFAEDRDISSPDVLREIVDDIGGDGRHALELAQTADVKAQLRASTSEAERLGIFGAPNFVASLEEPGSPATGGAPRRAASIELFFGHDRMDDAIAWVKRESRR